MNKTMMKGLCKVLGCIALIEILVFTGGYASGYIEGAKDRKKS